MRNCQGTGGEMDFELNEEQQQIKRTIREFAEAELRPHVSEWDEAAHFPVELRPKFAELGILGVQIRSEEHTSELQSHSDLVCRLLLEKKKKNKNKTLDGN